MLTVYYANHVKADDYAEFLMRNNLDVGLLARNEHLLASALYVCDIERVDCLLNYVYAQSRVEESNPSPRAVCIHSLDFEVFFSLINDPERVQKYVSSLHVSTANGVEKYSLYVEILNVHEL